MVTSSRGLWGLIWVGLFVGAARAIQGEVPPHDEAVSPGNVALIGAAAVYAARSIYELILERRHGSGDTDTAKMENLQQRLLDLYADHARAEERTLVALGTAVGEIRDHVLANSQQLQQVVAQQTALQAVLGQTQQAVAHCLAQQRRGDLR